MAMLENMMTMMVIRSVIAEFEKDVVSRLHRIYILELKTIDV